MIWRSGANERCWLCGHSLRTKRRKLLFDLVTVNGRTVPACRGGCR